MCTYLAIYLIAAIESRDPSQSNNIWQIPRRDKSFKQVPRPSQVGTLSILDWCLLSIEEESSSLS